jgi:hypothetical protein
VRADDAGKTGPVKKPPYLGCHAILVGRGPEVCKIDRTFHTVASRGMIVFRIV